MNITILDSDRSEKWYWFYIDECCFLFFVYIFSPSTDGFFAPEILLRTTSKAHFLKAFRIRLVHNDWGHISDCLCSFPYNREQTGKLSSDVVIISTFYCSSIEHNRRDLKFSQNIYIRPFWTRKDSNRSGFCFEYFLLEYLSSFYELIWIELFRLNRKMHNNSTQGRSIINRIHNSKKLTITWRFCFINVKCTFVR